MVDPMFKPMVKNCNVVNQWLWLMVNVWLQWGRLAVCWTPKVASGRSRRPAHGPTASHTTCGYPQLALAEQFLLLLLLAVKTKGSRHRPIPKGDDVA